MPNNKGCKWMPPENTIKLIQMIKKGISVRRVSKELGVSESTVRRQWRNSGEKFRPIDYKGGLL